ncbi:MAG: hypothetical protein U0800_06885 [Isosphaeraceae bacterium]
MATIMTAPWIDEGIRQLRLAVLWACSVRAPGTPDGAEQARKLARRLRDEVIDPSLRHEWIPGIADQVRRIQQDIREKPGRQGLTRAALDRLDRIESRFRAAFDGTPTRPSPAGADRLPFVLHCAVDAALGIEGAASEGSGWGGLGDPAALQPPARKQAAAWLAQGAALAAWEPLSWDADLQAESEANLRRVPALADDCRRIRAWLIDGSADRPSIPAGPLADEAAEHLDRCARALDRLREAADWPEGDGRAARDPKGPLKAVAEEIRRGPQPWIPLLLLEFQKALGAIDEAGLDSALHDAAARNPPNDVAAAGHLVLLALADRLASLQLAADHPAWDELERLGKRLLDSPSESIEVVRTPRAGMARLDEVLADGRPCRVITPGLVVAKGAERRVIRHARIETPRRQADAPILARRLAASIRSDQPELAELFDRVAADLNSRPELASAWTAIRDDPESLGRFWQGVQRASALALEKVPAAADFLAELGRTFQFVPPTGKGPTRDGWRIARDGNARQAGPLRGVPGLALKGPDGTVVEPAGWIRIPAHWDSPLLRRLEEVQPLIDGLRAIDPHWEGWATADAMPWDLAHRGDGDRPGPVDPEAARAAFVAVYDRSRRPQGPAGERLPQAGRRHPCRPGRFRGGLLAGAGARDAPAPKHHPGHAHPMGDRASPGGHVAPRRPVRRGRTAGRGRDEPGPRPSPETLAWARWLGQAPLRKSRPSATGGPSCPACSPGPTSSGPAPGKSASGSASGRGRATGPTPSIAWWRRPVPMTRPDRCSARSPPPDGARSGPGSAPAGRPTGPRAPRRDRSRARPGKHSPGCRSDSPPRAGSGMQSPPTSSAASSAWAIPRPDRRSPRRSNWNGSRGRRARISRTPPGTSCTPRSIRPSA